MRWLFGTLLFLAGVLVGFTLPVLRAIQFSPTVDAGNVLNAVVILLIGILIDYAYTSQASAKRSDTELLLEIVRHARAACDALQVACQPCERGKKLMPAEQAALSSAERELSNALHSIEEALQHCGVKLRTLDFDRVKEARLNLKEALTDDPFPGPYDDASVRSIRRAFKSMYDELTRITFKVNQR